MERNSLEEALNVFIKELVKSDINTYDKLELLINMKHFLDPEMYEENIKTLRMVKEWKFTKK